MQVHQCQSPGCECCSLLGLQKYVVRTSTWKASGRVVTALILASYLVALSPISLQIRFFNPPTASFDCITTSPLHTPGDIHVTPHSTTVRTRQDQSSASDILPKSASRKPRYGLPKFPDVPAGVWWRARPLLDYLASHHIPTVGELKVPGRMLRIADCSPESGTVSDTAVQQG